MEQSNEKPEIEMMVPVEPKMTVQFAWAIQVENPYSLEWWVTYVDVLQADTEETPAGMAWRAKVDAVMKDEPLGVTSRFVTDLVVDLGFRTYDDAGNETGHFAVIKPRTGSLGEVSSAIDLVRVFAAYTKRFERLYTGTFTVHADAEGLAPAILGIGIMWASIVEGGMVTNDDWFEAMDEAWRNGVTPRQLFSMPDAPVSPPNPPSDQEHTEDPMADAEDATPEAGEG